MFLATAPMDISMISADILLLASLAVGFGFWIAGRVQKKRRYKKEVVFALPPLIFLLGVLVTLINLIFQFTGG